MGRRGVAAGQVKLGLNWVGWKDLTAISRSCFLALTKPSEESIVFIILTSKRFPTPLQTLSLPTGR